MKWKPATADMAAFHKVCAHYEMWDEAIVTAMRSALDTGRKAFVIYRMIERSLK